MESDLLLRQTFLNTHGKPRSKSLRPEGKRYAFALFITFVAIGLHFIIRDHVDKDAFDLFLGAVFLSALYGGRGPAFVTSIASIIAMDFFFIAPLNAFAYALTDLLRLAVFGSVAMLTSSLSVRLKQAHDNLAKAHDDLEEKVQRRTEDLRLEIAHRIQAEKTILEISNREQRRLGQDLHDGLCQILVGIKFISEELKENLAKQGSPQQKDAALIESRLSEALAQADVVSRGLYPIELETNGLMAALQELSTKMSKIHSVQCEFHCSEVISIKDVAVATHVYRIAQEAVTNAIKRGKAKQIDIRLRNRRSHISLAISDRGVGFEPKSARPGMGLKIMEYRARVIHGAFRFRSRPGKGTWIVCTFPPPF